MGFHLLRTLFTNLALVQMIMFAFSPTPSSTTPTYNFPMAKPTCIDRCGNISIPYPFGTAANCYQSHDFWVTCNRTFYDPPKLFLRNGTVEISSISLYGHLKVMQFVAYDCYTRDGTRNSSNPWIWVPRPFTVNNKANKITIVGCDAYGFVYGRRFNRNYTTGCTATCEAKSDLVEGSCMGLGCCQTFIPQDVWRVEIELHSFSNYSKVWNISNCGYGFVADESAFNFSSKNLTNLKNVQKLPMVIDWTIGNETCENAKKNSSAYACKDPNSMCYKPDNGYGYRCRCKDGYHGNPYLNDGCIDIDECQIPGHPKCKYDCVNTPGGYYCPCPKGSHGDGTIEGDNCSRGESSLTLKLVAGTSIGGVVLLLAFFFMYLGVNKRRSRRAKKKFFFQNGGMLLQEKLTDRESSQDVMKIYISAELRRATNNFHNNSIIGQGGFGIVYKGILPDNKIVAIKKSKRVDPNQIEQFINEVFVLSQINHRNAVKLLGCCLETEVPLLVYEFISNGTLSTHLHNQAKVQLLNWDMRLKIATETAGMLSYLHFAASTPIIHRDIKSDNILLDHTFTAKVSDFGASRLVPLDQTQLSTMVQGTLGYLDPEYLQTHQLTLKSDVYSFGVVILELLTGRKAISFVRPENERNLTNYFLSILEQEGLPQLLDYNIVSEENMGQIMEVVRLAQWCINLKGEDRPTMKEVAMKLEGLRLGRAHSWAQTKQNDTEKESLLGEGLNGITNGCSSSTSAGRDDSLRDHAILPMSGGR